MLLSSSREETLSALRGGLFTIPSGFALAGLTGAEALYFFILFVAVRVLSCD